MIQEIEIEKVKNQVDFLSLVADYGLGIERQGKDSFIKCPFHQDETASLSIDASRNIYHCFGCGDKGNVIQFVQKMDQVGFRDAFHKLSNPSVAVIPAKKQSKVNPFKQEPINKRDVMNQIWQTFKENFEGSNEAQEYLHTKRFIAPFKGLEVGFCPQNFGVKLSESERERLQQVGVINDQGKDHFVNCLVFALRDEHGQIKSFYGRKIKGVGSHFYLPGPREGLFYHKKNSSKLIVVESVLDALSLIDKGFADVVSLYGVNGFTSDHEKMIENYSQVYFLLDGDRSGREAAHKLASKVKQLKKKQVHVIELPENEDPNSFFSLAAKKEERKIWLAKELETLTPKALPEMTLSEEQGVLVCYGKTLKYSIQGLMNQGMDKMKVTIRATLKAEPSQFVIDSVDLYSRRQRTNLIEGICEELAQNNAQLHSEIKTLITLLEKEKLKEDQAEQGVVELSQSEKDDAMQALKDPNLIENLLKSFESYMIGEEEAKLVGYLGTVSRLLPEPLGVLIVSRSGAGKTTLQDAICSFVPEEDLEKYTRLTGQALFYQAEDGLKHKVLAIEEEEGMQEAIYAIRTLQSSQRLSVVTTRSDPKSGKFKTEKYTVEGPVFILISTTNPEAMDYETRNRFVILTIDESEDQTKRIMNARKHAYTLEGRIQHQSVTRELNKFVNIQRLLKPMEVVNNYAPDLEYPFDRLQMRREFRKYMTLINSIALLHQYQREVKTYEKDGKVHSYIEANIEDIAIANRLVLKFFPNAIDELAPHTRRLGEEISKMMEAKGGDVHFNRRELRDFTNWSDWQIREGLKQLEELEYITRLTGRQGALVTYEMQVDVREDHRQKLMLTDPERLREQIYKVKAV